MVLEFAHHLGELMKTALPTSAKLELLLRCWRPINAGMASVDV